MEKVYEILYNNDHSEEINFVDMGDQNAYDMIAEFAKFSIEMCVGQVTSNGWKELDNYPNDFKVIVNASKRLTTQTQELNYWFF